MLRGLKEVHAEDNDQRFQWVTKARVGCDCIVDQRQEKKSASE
jgi:hypothetical protein